MFVSKSKTFILEIISLILVGVGSIVSTGLEISTNQHQITNLNRKSIYANSLRMRGSSTFTSEPPLESKHRKWERGRLKGSGNYIINIVLLNWYTFVIRIWIPLVLLSYFGLHDITLKRLIR